MRKNLDELNAIKTELLHLDPETIGQALQDVIADEMGIDTLPPETAEDWRAQNLVVELLEGQE